MELTVREMAEREQVTVRTVRRWIAKGAVPIRRTPGRGIRVLSDGSVTGSKVVIMPSPLTSEDKRGQSSN